MRMRRRELGGRSIIEGFGRAPLMQIPGCAVPWVLLFWEMLCIGKGWESGNVPSNLSGSPQVRCRFVPLIPLNFT
jgi:hypothetical protein